MVENSQNNYLRTDVFMIKKENKSAHEEVHINIKDFDSIVINDTLYVRGV